MTLGGYYSERGDPITSCPESLIYVSILRSFAAEYCLSIAQLSI